MHLHEMISGIQSKEDFIKFISALRKTTNNGSWENPTLEGFLEAMEAWVTDSKISIPDKLDWKVFANVLYASKIYE